MSFAHLTLPTQDVQATVRFFERTLGYQRLRTPENSPIEVEWLDVGRGQQFHVFHVEGFRVSEFEKEFGRHIAVFFPGSEFETLKQSLQREGAAIIDAIRPTPFARFFFKEPINGYVFEVIDKEHFIAE